MAHALREFIRAQMDQRNIDQATFTRTSGLTRSHVSKLLRDDRDRLPQIPRRETLAGIAQAFNVSEQVVLAMAVEALGLGYAAEDFVYELGDASDDELIAELARRSPARQGSYAARTVAAPVEDVDVVAAHSTRVPGDPDSRKIVWSTTGSGKTANFLAVYAYDLRNRLVHGSGPDDRGADELQLSEADELALDLIDSTPELLADTIPAEDLRELRALAARRHAGRTPGQQTRDALAKSGEGSQDPGGMEPS